MKIFFTATIIFLFIGLAKSNEITSRFYIKDGKNDFNCSVNMNGDVYRFIFYKMIDEKKLFEVNKSSVSSNTLEYAWLVHLGNKKVKADLGIYYFKSGGSQDQYYFNELVAKSQISLFVEKSGMQHLVSGSEKAIKVEHEDKNLIIEYHDPLIDELSINDFDQANFWVLTSGYKPLKCKATIDRYLKSD